VKTNWGYDPYKGKSFEIKKKQFAQNSKVGTIMSQNI
jgi:hypothetical protein